MVKFCACGVTKTIQPYGSSACIEFRCSADCAKRFPITHRQPVIPESVKDFERVSKKPRLKISA